MRVLGIRWTGVRVSQREAAEAFFAGVMGLEVVRKDEARGYTTFGLPSGQRFELLAADSAAARVHEDPVIAGFAVLDVEEARRELEEAGVELVTRTFGRRESGQWCYFRGPDGVVYQLCSD